MQYFSFFKTFMSSWSLKSKLLSSAIFSATLTIFVGFFVWFSMSKAQSNAEKVMKEVVPSVSIIKSILRDIEEFQKNYAIALYDRSSQDRFDDAVSNADRSYNRLVGFFQNFKELESDVALVDLKRSVLNDWSLLNQKSEMYMNALADKKWDEAEKGLRDFYEPMFSKIKDTIVNIELNNTNIIEKETQNSAIAEIQMKHAKILLLFGLTSAIVVSLLFTWIHVRGLNQRMALSVQELKRQVNSSLLCSEKMGESSFGLKNSIDVSNHLFLSISSALEKLRSCAHSNSNSAEEFSVTTKKSAQSLQLAVGIFQSICSLMESIREANKSVNETFGSVHLELEKIIQLTQDIEKKILKINDIVFQTKLLSFNASVEAARAGEHGLGFTVVSNEIAILAENSKKASCEIDAMVSSSRLHIEEIIKRTDKEMSHALNVVEGRIQSGLASVSEGIAMMNDIVEQSNQIDAMTDHISGLSKEQSTSIESVVFKMEELSKESSKTELASEVVRHIGDDIKAQAKEIENSLDTLNRFVKGNRS